MIRNIFTLSLSLFIAGMGIASALNLPTKVQKGEMLTSQNWNAMIDAIQSMQNKITSLETTLAIKANVSQIPTSPDLSKYALKTDITSNNLPNGWPKFIYCGESSETGTWVNTNVYSGDYMVGATRIRRYTSGSATDLQFVDINESTGTVYSTRIPAGRCKTGSSWAGITKIY